MKKTNGDRHVLPLSGRKLLMEQLFGKVVGMLHENKKAGAVCSIHVIFIPGFLAVVGGFEFALAIRWFFSWLTWPLQIILGIVFMLLLFFGYAKWLSSIESSRSNRKLDIGKLLERQVVPLPTSQASSILKGQTILVTGAAGSIGSELCRQLLNYEPKILIAMDTNETGLFDLAQSLRTHPFVRCFYPSIGDITDEQSMEQLFTKHRPHIVFHAAAYKHVPLLEQFPEQAVRTNILATYRLCHLAQEHHVTRFVFISTDKAAEPIGIMGASKRLGEIIVSAFSQSQDTMTSFCAVRFGNVIGSRGSVVPIFTQQIEQGGPITITHPDATRYFMTIPEACGLVIVAAVLATQRDSGLYLLDMGEPVRIMDLAEKMASMYGLRLGQNIALVVIGLRSGERLHETLVASYEELIPTSHNKIFSISQRGDLPSLTTVTQWIKALEFSLRYETDSQLRNALFKMVKEEATVSSS